MDHVLESISSYVASLDYRDLSADVVRHAKRRIIDTVGCALGCYENIPPRIARMHALEVKAKPGATVLGTRHRSAVEHAAFANGVMARYLDFNDTSMSGNAGHPSDNIFPILAAAEYADCDVRTAIAAIVLAYEVHAAFGRGCGNLRRNGWDNAAFVGIATAAGAAKVLGLDRDATAHAIALAAVPNAPMGQTRVGHLSMWKGCTAPNAARNAIFGALMARRGMTGPLEAIEGPRGFNAQLGTHMAAPRFGTGNAPYAVETDKYKCFPCDYEAQCALAPAFALHADLRDRLREIAHIDIETHDHAILISADTPAKWHPENRETADHSLPYVFAVGLTRGTVGLADFEDDRIRDPAIRALMQTIAVRATPECSRDWPDAYPFRITVTLKSGENFCAEARYPKGHPKNPLSDGDIEGKFRGLVEPLLGEGRATQALDGLWHIEELGSVRELFALFALEETTRAR